MANGGLASTGCKADGEPCRAIGLSDNGQRRNVHLAISPATSDIRAVEFIPSRDGDSPVLPDLLGQIPAGEQIGTVTAEGAYDTRRCHKAIIERDAVPIIPIRKNGRIWKEDCPAARDRNDTLRATRYYGRAFWKRWTRYHTRSRIALMNRFNALGTAEILRVA